jgi:hypothetical protein
MSTLAGTGHTAAARRPVGAKTFCTSPRGTPAAIFQLARGYGNGSSPFDLAGLAVSSGQDCFLFFGLTHPEKAGQISPQSGKKPSLTLNQPTWLARQAP